jgi:hypothetical protein
VSAARAAAVGVILFAGILTLAGLDGDHDWGDDFAEYTSHARNIVSGRPYAETTWVYTTAPMEAPRAYPPGFPLLIAPVYAAAGLNFRVLKIAPTLALTATLLLYAVLLRRRFDPWTLTAWALLSVTAPLIHLISGMVLSDFPFAMWSAASLVAIDRSTDAAQTPRRQWMWLTAAGAAAGVATATRTIGIVLLAVIAAHEVLWVRRLRTGALAAVAIGAAIAALGLWYAPAQLDYLALETGLPPFPQRAVRLAQLYAAETADVMPVMDGRYGRPLLGAIRSALGAPLEIDGTFGPGEAAALILLGVTVWGFIVRARRGAGAAEIFGALYLGALVSAPAVPAIRYLIPILPLLFAWLLEGAAALPIAPPRWKPAVLLSVSIVAAVVALAQGRAMPRTPGVMNPDAQAMFGFVRGHVAPGDLVVFGKPRAMALMTERATMAAPFTEDEPAILDYVTHANAAYVASGDTGDPAAITDVAARHPELFERVFMQGRFIVFHRRGRP